MKLMGGALQLTVPTTRQLKKAFHNFVLTIVCGFTTILVLKGTTGFDTEQPKNHASATSSSINRRSELQHARLLSEVNNLIHLLSHSTQFKSHLQQHNPLPGSDSDLTSESANRNPSLKLHLSSADGGDSKHQFEPRGIRHEHQSERHKGSFIHNPLQNSEETSDISNNSPIIYKDTTSSADYLAMVEIHELNPTVNPIYNPNSNSELEQNPNQNNDPATRRLADLSSVSSSRDDQIRTQSNSIAGGSKQHSILLVTGSQPYACENPMGDHYLTKSLKNKMDYGRLHNIAIFYSMANFDPEMSGFWAKLPLLQRLMLAHPEKEWLWWIDSDAMITDMAFELPMERYKDHNIILHGWKELVYEQKNWIGLNTGSFLIRNCQWSLDLLQAWAPMGPKGKVREEAGKLLSSALAGRPAFEADDQSALIYLLNEENSKWASKVYLENAYYLHGYWLIIVDKYEEMMEKHHPGYGDERWPFVTHFVGCKPCTKLTTAAEDKCLEHMERAFNFADNQILQHYGHQHEALNTHQLVNSSPK